jgi:tol-pal system protein YbgF
MAMAAVIALLPAAVSAQSKPSVEERLAKIERTLASGTLIQLLKSVEELKAEVRELRGELEVQGHTVAEMKGRQRELYLDVDRRLQRVETSGIPAAAAAGVAAAGTSAGSSSAPATAAGGTSTAPAGTQGGGTSVATAAPAAGAAAGAAVTSVDPVKEQQSYQKAFNLLKAGRYDQAAKAFQEFLGEYPTGQYSDNAQYWLGESYYVTRNFENAMREFEKLVNEHPDSQKLTHALLKIGYIHDELGQKQEAEQILTELTQTYPQSTAAGLARKRLQRLRSE